MFKFGKRPMDDAPANTEGENAICKRLSVLLAVSMGIIFYYGGQLKVAPLVALFAYPLFKKSISERFAAQLSVVICFFPAFIGLLQVAYWRDGFEGVDFGIFSQLIYQVAENNRFVTSLIGTEWHNFFTHHFSPYLLVLGVISKVGVPGEVLLIGCHVAAVTALVAGVFNLYRTKSEDSLAASLLTLTALFLPAVRIGLSWETHDEVLALPLLIWSLYAHFENRNIFKLLILLPALLFKETLALNVTMLCTIFAFQETDRGSRLRCIFLALVALLEFVLYTKILPHWLWYPTFDGTSRLSSLDQLMTGSIIRAKLSWLLVSTIPAVPLLFLHSRQTLRQSLLILAAVGSNYAAILLTNLPNMYEPYNYYSITPVMMTFLAFSIPVAGDRRLFRSLLASLVITSLVGHRIEVREILKRGFLVPSAYTEIEELITPDKVVIADDFTTSILARNKQVKRLFHANRQLPRFDFILTRREIDPKLSSFLNAWSRPCGETRRFAIRCAKSGNTIIRRATTNT